MRPRLAVPVLVVLALTAVGFLAARALTQRDAAADAQHRAEIAATEVRGGLDQAANLIESLRRFLLGDDVTNTEFVDIGQRWLSPVGLPAAAWVERVPRSDGSEALRATLVTGADPLATAGIDLGTEQALAAAIADNRTLFRVRATPLTRVRGGRTGIFLAQSAPRLDEGVLQPGFVVLFVPGSWLVAEVTKEADPNLELRVGKTSYGGLGGARPVASSFEAAGQRFDLLVPEERLRGAEALLPWLVVGAGILLAALAGVLATIAERRTRAQREVDRIFTLSPDPIVVVGPDGYFTRVNPAFERLLGYTTEELRARPVLDFVHPDDRDRSEAEGRALRVGRATVGFENRYVCRDESVRWLEWTVTRAPRDLVFAVARDVTERRQTEHEQAALRRVAILVARAATPDELFEAVVTEVGGIFDWPWVGLMRYDSDHSFVVVATCGNHPFPVGSRWPLDGPSTFESVLRTGRPARFADYSGASGAVAEAARRGGILGGIGAPIIVNGKTWGVIAAPITSARSIAEGAEARLSRFTDLVATAIANAESRAAVARLADEQAALRRVATLVAEGAPSAELFSVVTKEVAGVFSHAEPDLVATVIRFDPGPESVLVGASRAYEREPVGSRWEPKELYVSTRVLRTGRSARVHESELDSIGGPDAEVLRLRGFHHQVGSPVVVEGRLWGAMCLNARHALPPDTDGRLESFTELIATAIANAESREALAELADEQAALRRVATLVARGIGPERVFQAVAAEVGVLIGSQVGAIVRFEDDATVTVLGDVGSPHKVGARVTLDPGYVVDRVRVTSRAARFDTDDPSAEQKFSLVRSLGIRSAIASPIVVAGELWGAVTTASLDRLLPPGAERRLTEFTALLATAVANTEAREEITGLVKEQAALRRVATLVAEAVPPAEIFSAVSREVELVSGVDPDTTDAATVVRFDPGDECVLVGASKPIAETPLGLRWQPNELYVSTRVLRTGRSARVDEAELDAVGGPEAVKLRRQGYLSQVGSPIVVEGRLWGAMTVSGRETLSPGTDGRLEKFTELVATAIANAESRQAIARLADEQAALRRVATLVAEGAPQAEVFDKAAREVAQVLRVRMVTIDRYDPDEFSTVVASVEDPGFPVGSRWPLDGPSLGAKVLQTGRPARIDSYADLESTAAAAMREWSVRSAVGVPILVDGRVWGVICVGTTEEARLPDRTEERLVDFTELLATSIARTESRDAIQRVAEEQAALRRVAELVAREASQKEVFAAIAEEIGRLLGTDEIRMLRYEGDTSAVVVAGSGDRKDVFPVGFRAPLGGDNAASRVFRTGLPARIEDYRQASGPIADAVRPSGLRSVVATPIVVEGRRWGVMVVGTLSSDPPPPDTERRLGQFTELMATAIANAEARAEVERLAEEQSALRRVATLVAEGAPSDEVFAAVVEEVGHLLPVTSAALGRFEPDDRVTTVAAWTTSEVAFPAGRSWTTEGKNVTGMVQRTRRPARIDDFSDASGPIGINAQEAGYRSSVGSPIIVEGRLWGIVSAASTAIEPLPADTEARLSSFTELLATLFSRLEAREALERLADEQAALRRVATVVASAAPPSEVFAAVAEEVGGVLGVQVVNIVRHEGDAATAVASWSAVGGTIPLGTRLPLSGPSIMGEVARTGRPARIDAYADVPGAVTYLVEGIEIRAGVGAPIVVDDRVWGTVVALTTQPAPLPADTEARLADFTELVATAISNAQAGENLLRLAEEQAALRRVATLVAQGAPPAETFAVVSEEVGQLFGSGTAAIERFEEDGRTLVYVGVSKKIEPVIPVGTRWRMDESLAAAEVYRTGLATRSDDVDWSALEGPIALAGRRMKVASTVASPILVEGRLWGAAIVTSTKRLPDDAEERLQKFAEIVATAIANAEGKSELAASRKRIVTASDEARRRIERDLHDGVQQRLVSLGLEVGAIEAALPTDPELDAKLARITSGLAGVLDDLVEISRGIHPAILSQGGLGPALRTLARRSSVPVELDSRIEGRLPEPVEVAAYYVVSEALTNAAKHAHASVVRVGAATDEGVIRLSIRDDGIGGADPGRGSGLVGLQDRVEALGGTIFFESAPGKGTSLFVTLPLDVAATHD